VLAVYSSHPSGPLSLLARSAPFTPDSFGALEQRRQALRLPAMRGSAFLVPADAAGRIFSATRWSPAQLAARLRALSLDPDTYAALRPRILQAAREPISPRDLQRALKSDASVVLAMRTMAREGLILRVGWNHRVRTDSLRWVATDAWLGRSLDEADPDAALRWLVEAYFGIFGPARVEDVAWWIGLPGGKARQVVSGLDLTAVEDGLLLPAHLADAYASVQPVDPDAIDVLPKWDPYTMGYAPDGRRRLVDDEHLPLAYTTAGSRVGATAGDGLPLILRGGRAVASWEHRLSGQQMVVTIRPFGTESLPEREVLAAAFARVSTLLSASLDLNLS
jgi:hypothetical protein